MSTTTVGATLPATAGAAPGRITSVGGRLCLMPFPIVAEVAVDDGVLLLLRCPVGIASPVSVVKVGADGVIRWTAEPCAWPPRHDPYVDVVAVDGRLIATSASGWAVELDAATGTGSLIGRAD